MGKNLTPQQQKGKWEKRARQIEANVGAGFKSSMLQIEKLSRAELNRMVYAKASPTKRSADLKNSEVMRYPSATEALLTNTTNTTWKGVKTYYGWVVHEGRKALDKGRKVFAWMKDPRATDRPTTLQGWREALKAGRAIWAHRLRAVAARPWRKRAIEQARSRGVIANSIRGGIRKTMSDADRIE